MSLREPIPLREPWQRVIPADLTRVGPLVLETASFLEHRGVGPEPCYRAQLLLEEVVTNVVRHGFGGAAGHDVRVDVALDEAGISLVILDEAPPFDPIRESPEPDLERPLPERRVGGLGIHLVKLMADELSYERRDGRNRIAMRVSLTPRRSGPSRSIA